jgi:hypothetical protein
VQSIQFKLKEKHELDKMCSVLYFGNI